MDEQTTYLQAGAVPIPQKNDRADLIDKIKPETSLEAVKYMLMGYRYIASSNRWEQNPALQELALTETGAEYISGLMYGVSTINTTISRYDKSEIRARLRNTIKDMLTMIHSKWKEYGIDTVGKVAYVHNLVFSNTMAVLNQAGDGSIQELLKGTTFEQRMVTSERKQEGGKLRRWLGF